MRLPIYKITIDEQYSEGEDLGIEEIAFTSNPAIIIKGMAFNNQKKTEKLFFSDKSKMRIAAPALTPDIIYRNDEHGEYYVQFTVEEIEKIHNKFMMNLSNSNKFNLEHNQENKVPAFILETWIVDEPKLDKSYSTFGIEVPKGTMFVIAQITDETYYNELVANKQVGFSIEGFLGFQLSEIKKEEEKIKMEEMKLPDGEYTQGDKIYVYKNGSVVEVKDVVTEEVKAVDAVNEENKTEVPVEEVKAAEAPVEEEVKTEEEVKAADELPIVEPIVEGGVSYTKEEVDAKLDEIYTMIADIKSLVEGVQSEEVIEDQIPVAMSLHNKLSAFNALSKII